MDASNLASVLDWYREPLFWWFPVASVVLSTVAFAAFAAPLTWIAAQAPQALERYRIQNRRARSQDLVGPSIRSWLYNNLWHLGLVFLAWLLLRLTGVHGGALPAWYVIAGQVLFFIYLVSVDPDPLAAVQRRGAPPRCPPRQGQGELRRILVLDRSRVRDPVQGIRAAPSLVA